MRSAPVSARAEGRRGVRGRLGRTSTWLTLVRTWLTLVRPSYTHSTGKRPENRTPCAHAGGRAQVPTAAPKWTASPLSGRRGRASPASASSSFSTSMRPASTCAAADSEFQISIEISNFRVFRHTSHDFNCCRARGVPRACAAASTRGGAGACLVRVRARGRVRLVRGERRGVSD